LAEEFKKTISLTDKRLDELATELALLPEGSEEADMYHAELARRENQSTLDAATAQLVSEKRRYPPWTVIILGVAILAMVASMLLQK
jgi:hypothetical protein